MISQRRAKQQWGDAIYFDTSHFWLKSLLTQIRSKPETTQICLNTNNSALNNFMVSPNMSSNNSHNRISNVGVNVLLLFYAQLRGQILKNM